MNAINFINTLLRHEQLILCTFHTAAIFFGVAAIYIGTHPNPGRKIANKELEIAFDNVTILIGILYCITGATGVYGAIRYGPVLVLNACLIVVTCLAIFLQKMISLKMNPQRAPTYTYGWQKM